MSTGTNKAQAAHPFPRGDFQVLSIPEYNALRKLARFGEESKARIEALEALLRRGVELTPDKRLAWWKDARALLGEKICANCVSFYRVYMDLAIGGCHKQSGKPHSCTMSDECSIDAFEPRKEG